MGYLAVVVKEGPGLLIPEEVHIVCVWAVFRSIGHLAMPSLPILAVILFDNRTERKMYSQLPVYRVTRNDWRERTDEVKLKQTVTARPQTMT